MDEEYPIGFRFKPKDEELIKYYLVPSLKHLPTVPNDCITACDVYMCHPDTLTKEHKGTDQEEWYFLSPRSRMYGNGVRPARKTRDGRGRWKASTAAKEVEEKVVYKGITFCRSVLNYFEGIPKNEVRTKWIMLELRVPCFEIKLDKPGPKNMLDEYVVCKIYVSPQHKKKGDADEEGTSGSSACEDDDGGAEEENPFSPTQHGQGAAGSSMLSDKQAGKRPMLDKVRPGSLGIIAPTQGQGSCSNGTAPKTVACYGVPPGQPTGAHSGQALQMQMQMQMQMQRQAGAFSGQRLMVQQPTQQTPPSFSHARDHPFGQTTATMTTRPPAAPEKPGFPFPGNSHPPRRDPGTTTAFRPQVSLQCYYDKNYRGVKPPPAAGTASSSQPQMLSSLSSFDSFLPPQQQPFFNGDANRRVAAAAPNPGGMACSSYQYQATGNGGSANGINNGAPRFNVNAEQYFVDLAMTMINPSLTGARTQTAAAPAPARLVEFQAPAEPGGGKVKTETEETPGFNRKDAV